MVGDLNAGLQDEVVDVLVFNPPYVPTDDPLPQPPADQDGQQSRNPTFEEDSSFLELSYAGGKDGMEVTDRLLDLIPYMLSNRGVAYILLCAQNKPVEVVEKLQKWGSRWETEIVGSSGKQAGWEKLVIVRIARAI